jgi:pimeloyl-ACP methyl ester carboxylesterase
MRPMMRAIPLLLFCSLLPCPTAGQDVGAARVRVNGVDLTYIERGRGEPLILLHGGQGDYRSWGPQIEAFSGRFHVISYSRRYNYPNDNPIATDYRSAYTDADDLAALIRQMGLGRVHLVGTSAGALAALVLATEEPGMVSTLVLAEPPVHSWAKNDPNGRALYNEFMSSIWDPAGAAFKAGDDLGAMRILVDGFGGSGKFDSLSAETRAAAMQNARFFRAATSSHDPFPDIPKDGISRLKMPVLIVTGETTISLHKFVNDELARLLPTARRVTIPRTGHGSARENPLAFNEAVAAFLAANGR